MILTRDTLELEIVFQDYKYKGIRRLVLHIGFPDSIPLHLDGYKGIELLKLAPNRGYTHFKSDRFPFILWWGCGHFRPCETLEKGTMTFELLKHRFMSETIQGSA